MFVLLTYLMWYISNPQEAVQMWTTTMLEFDAIPVVLQCTKRTLRMFLEAVEKLLYTEIKVARTSDWIRAYQTALM